MILICCLAVITSIYCQASVFDLLDKNGSKNK